MILFFIINGKPSAIEWNKNQLVFRKKKARVFLINQNEASNWKTLYIIDSNQYVIELVAYVSVLLVYFF